MPQYLRTTDTFEDGIFHKGGTTVFWEPSDGCPKPPSHYKLIDEEPAAPVVPAVIPVLVGEPVPGEQLLPPRPSPVPDESKTG